MAKHRRRSSAAGAQLLHRFTAVVLPLLVFGGLLGAGYAYLTRPGRMPLRVIEITGEFTFLEKGAIEQRVEKVIGGGFFDVDLQQLQQQVRMMPWVEQVSVRRVWPDTLRMHVTEQVPLAYWNKDALVNLQGEVFRPETVPEQHGLPHLHGEDASAPRVVGFYLQLHTRLLSGPLRIETIELNRRGEWKVGFRNGLLLMLGREDVAQRQQTFLQVYPELLAYGHRQPERIDMRYEHGLAVRWRETTGGSG